MLEVLFTKVKSESIIISIKIVKTYSRRYL